MSKKRYKIGVVYAIWKRHELTNLTFSYMQNQKEK